MAHERDDPMRGGGLIDLVIFVLWAAIIVFATSQL
jgi:hypothetical protein